MSLLLALTVAEAIAQVGGVKDRPKKRLRQSAYVPPPLEIQQPVPRNDDDEVILLMVLGALK